MSTNWHFAVDFGTSNTSAAHTAPMSGTVETVALTHRSNLMPSAVYQEEGQVLAGDTALLRGRRDASKLLLSPKRYIDHDHVNLGGAETDTKQLIAAVIATALQRAQAQHAGTAPTTVTLTHPEAWSIHSVEQLKQAAVTAGIRPESIRTISEPRAAAVHYAEQQRIPEGGHVAVFDFGGGTLDIAVLRALADGNFTVVAAKGDNSLGGRTVDNLMFRWVLTQLEHDDPDFADYLRSAPVSVMHSLEEAIREAKEILSDTSSASISVSTPNGERDVLITRDEFNGIIQDSINRAVELTRAALQQAGVDETTTPIYMTGGSSRIPYVQNRLGEIGTVMTLDDPKTVVSRGALRATLKGYTEGGSGAAAAPAPTASASAAPSSAPASNPYEHNPYAQTPPPAQPAVPPQFARPQSSAPSTAVPSSTATKSGGSKALIFGVLGVALVGAIGAGIALTQMGGDEPKTTDTAASSSPSSNNDSKNSKPAASGNSGSANSNAGKVSENLANERHIVNREPTVKDVLPAEFLNRIRVCNDPRADGAGGGLLRDSDIKTYPCLVENSELGDKQNETAYTGVKYVAVGDDAQRGYDAIQQQTRLKVEKFQDAGQGKPELLLGVSNGQDTSPDWVAWYPEKKVLVASHTGPNYRGKEEEYFKFFGFMK